MEDIWYWIGDHLALLMFAALTVVMFIGFPVAFVLGGVGLMFGFVGILFEVFQPVQFFNIVPRIWGRRSRTRF